MIIKRIFSFSQSLPRWQRLIIFIALCAIGIIFYPEFGCKIENFWDWLGFKGKDFWDWLQLAGVPVSLALLGITFQRQQSQENKDEKRSEILQVYFDRISQLLVDKNLIDRIKRAELQESEDSQRDYLIESSRSIIRARTLSFLC